MSDKLVLVPELMGTATAMADEKTRGAMKSDMNGVVKATLGVSFDSTKLSAVENSDKVVHLCLPYYNNLSSVEQGMVADEAMASVVGGLTTQEFEANWHQAWDNARLVLMGHPSKVNNNYDGTFDVENDSTGFKK